MGRRHDELMERATAVPILRSDADRVLLAQKGDGARVFDIDDVGYIDYIGACGSAIVGFANPFVFDAVRKVLAAGIPEGFHVVQEVELAEILGHFLPWVDSWWFCRSQDEAFRHVLRWAHMKTGKSSFLVLDGGAPMRVGVPADLAIDPMNPIREVRGWDVAEIIAAVTSGSTKVAALILDPLMGRFGVVPPPDGVLEKIVDACRGNGVLVILDERVSGFRVHRGGAAALAGIIPDAAVYGAALGGGFPIGVAAFRDNQELLDEYGPMPTPYPVSLAAAEATLSILKNDSVYEHLEKRTEQLVQGLFGLAERFSRPMVINRVGSVFALYLSDNPVVDRTTVESSDGAAYRRLAVLLRGERVLLPWEPGRAAFLSSTHRAKDVEETLGAFEKVLPRLHQEDFP